MTICIICNKPTKCEFFDKVNDIIMCTECGCIFSKNKIDEIFPNITGSGLSQIIKNKIEVLTALSYYKFLKMYDLKIASCFDIGAGEGHFLRILEGNGIEVSGIEYNESTWKQRKIKSIVLGNFESYTTENKYDLISINQALYYFEESITILKKIQNMLNPNGHVLIVTTNMDSEFRKKNKIWTQGCKICLSEKNFKNLTTIGLKVIDIQQFDDKIYRDYFISKNSIYKKIIFFIKLFSRLFVFKNFIYKKNNGIHNYILLKKL